MNDSTTRLERQDRILDATLRVIGRDGVDSVSMATIARESGLSRPALYQYFSSQEDIFAELVINELADFSNALDARVAIHDDPREQVRVWVHYSLAHLASAEHRLIRNISVDSLPEEKHGILRALHGQLMLSLMSPLRALGLTDPTSTCHLIYASVAEAAKRIDAGVEFAHEAAALEPFVMAGIDGALNSRR